MAVVINVLIAEVRQDVVRSLSFRAPTLWSGRNLQLYYKNPPEIKLHKPKNVSPSRQGESGGIIFPSADDLRDAPLDAETVPQQYMDYPPAVVEVVLKAHRDNLVLLAVDNKIQFINYFKRILTAAGINDGDPLHVNLTECFKYFSSLNNEEGVEHRESEVLKAKEWFQSLPFKARNMLNPFHMIESSCS